MAACPHHLRVAVDSSLSSPSRSPRARTAPSVLSRPPHRWPPRRVAPPPEGPGPSGGQRRRAPAAVDPRHADAGARPSKKPDVSSDRIGAASRRPRVVVNLSEWGSVCVRYRRGPAHGPHVSRSTAAINARLRTRNKFQALLPSSYH